MYTKEIKAFPSTPQYHKPLFYIFYMFYVIYYSRIWKWPFQHVRCAMCTLRPPYVEHAVVTCCFDEEGEVYKRVPLFCSCKYEGCLKMTKPRYN